MEMFSRCCSLSKDRKLSCRTCDIFWVVPGVSGGTPCDVCMSATGKNGRGQTNHEEEDDTKIKMFLTDDNDEWMCG